MSRDASPDMSPGMGRGLYLIGMPGCGKTTLGCALAKAFGLPFVDVDERIVALAGMDIPHIFAERGELEFREIEHRALAEICAGPVQVVATGGGAMLRADNVALMREAGTVLWVDRPLDHILTDVRQDTRPLLAGDAAERLRTLHAQREPLYRAAAHLRLESATTRSQTLQRALELLASEGFRQAEPLRRAPE